MKRMKIAGAIIAIALASLTACTSDTEGGDSPQAVPGTDGCTSVVVGTSSEKVNLMEDLGEKFKESSEAKGLDGCVTVYPINVPSGKGSEILSTSPTSYPNLEKEFWPTVWSPASTVWTDRVASATGNASFEDAKSFTKTPVVLGMPESMAKALGYPKQAISMKQIEKLVSDPQGWGSVGKGIWGDFKIAKTNPNTSTTGLSTILMQSYAAAGKTKDLTADDVQKAEKFSRAFELGAIHYGDTTGNVLKTLYSNSMNGGGGSTYVSAVALEETSLINYNKGNPDSHTVQPGEQLTPPKEKLVAIYPTEGSMFSDNPAVALPNSWVSGEQRKASDAFVKFLQTKDAQETLPKYGFRPLDDKADVSADLNVGVGVDTKMPKTTLPKPANSVVSAAIDQWADIRKPSAVLELIDISGSMNDPIAKGKTRLDGAIEGASGTLNNFRSTDLVGVWSFTTDIKSKHGEGVWPVRELGPLKGDGEKLVDDIADLRNAKMNGTPLYDSLALAYDYMAKQAEPGRINAIVLLSDGEDSGSRTSLTSLLSKIRDSAKEGSNKPPVRIFAIAYGSGADKDELAQIAAASGGQVFDASDETRIKEVFTSVINNF